MCYSEAQTYITAVLEQRQKEVREKYTLAYCAVVWNRVEPKDVPSLADIIGVDSNGADKTPQTVDEQADILKTFAARSKRGGGYGNKS